MAEEVLKRDQNHVTVLGGVTDDSNSYVTMLRVDPISKRLLVSATGLPGSGTVTSVSVVTAHGFSGTVATATSTPAITISTTVTGILQGNGTSISAITVGSGLSFIGGTLSATGSGGTVTSVSVVSANGFTGTVANPTTTPEITIATSVTGILQGNSTAISAVTIGSGLSFVGGTLSATGSGGTVTSVASADGSITVTNPTSTVDLAVVKAPIWSTARLLAGNSVNGSANVAFANKFIVQGTTDTGLTGAQFLGALSTGIVKNTTATGVLSIAVPGTDYVTPGTMHIDQTPDNGTYGLLSGSVNGSNTRFTVSAGAYTSGKLTVYLNGLVQMQGASDDFTETTPASGTFDFVLAPFSGDIITAQYI